jgi:hypothetical protein
MKVLQGSLRKAFAFLFAEWKSLLGVSLAPLIVSIVLGAGQMFLFRHYFANMMGRLLSGQLDVSTMNAMMQLQAFSLVSQIISLLIMAYLFVRIVRLYIHGERGVFDFSKPVMSASLMTALYSMGIFLLTMVVFFVAFVGFTIFVVIIAGIMSVTGTVASPVVSALGALISIAGILAMMSFIVWFGARFAVGLPAVALGKTPDFFRDMWRLSRGESWGVPLRLLGLYAIMLIILIPVMALFGYRMFSQIAADISTIPEAEFVRLMASGMFGDFLWLMPVFTILGTIFAWLASALFTETYLRFMKRDGKPAV